MLKEWDSGPLYHKFARPDVRQQLKDTGVLSNNYNCGLYQQYCEIGFKLHYTHMMLNTSCHTEQCKWDITQYVVCIVYIVLSFS